MADAMGRPRICSAVAAVAALLFGWALHGCRGAPDAASANIVVVSVDTLRADAIAPYGGPARTPVLARLAREGVLFESAFAPAPSTAPSHATLFTGREPLDHGVVENTAPLPEEAATLAEAARAGGRATAAFVSSFILDRRFGWDQGFEHYDDVFSQETASAPLGRGAPPELIEAHQITVFDRRAGATTRAARAWLESATEPFFLFVHYFDPHNPYTPPPAFAQRTQQLEVDLSGRRVPDLDDEKLRARLRLYYAEVELVDAALGQLLEPLSQLEKPTLVVFTADHGEGLGDRGWLFHMVHLHDELIRVPLILWRSDRALGGHRIRRPVGLVDIAPTLGELAGLSGFRPEDGVDGRSLAASVERGTAPELREILGHRPYLAESAEAYRPERFAVRRGRWKLMRTEGAADQLYDLEDDPGETRDVRARHPDVAAALGQLLDDRIAARRPAIPVASPSDQIREGLRALGYAE